jgi:catechol 2,3-dioxygenase-like lactoylglutathione lyase family enzyme
MGRITAIEHVQLAMPAGREDEARDFYGRILGIPEVRVYVSDPFGNRIELIEPLGE